MGWLEASIIFIIGLVCFAVILPVGQALLPSIKDTMGATVGLMVSAMFVVILVVIVMMYFRQSQGPDNFLGSPGVENQ